jgi:hypothetical protein
MANFIIDYLNQFYDEITPLDFYRSIFPEGELEEKGNQQHGKYNAIAVELLPKEETVENKRQNVKRYLVHDGLEKLPELLKSDNFIIISPISYAGKSRISANARYIYALAIDVDGIEEKSHIETLFNLFTDTPYWGSLPRPTYIVASGTGLHLYYQFEKPIPCFPNINKQMAALKKQLTSKIWNPKTTTLSKNIQYESLFQGFRIVGGITKSGSRTKAFITGKKVSIEYLNQFVAEVNQVKEYTYKSNLTLAEAKKKYPEWYKKRIEDKAPVGCWTCKKDLFNWWIRKIGEYAEEGHRYYCIMCLAVYAKKCGISREELEEMAFSLVDPLNRLTKTENNPFTRTDVLAALEMYNDNYIRFPIKSISSLCNVPIEKNKRNGMTQSLHLEIARSTKKIKVAAGISKYAGGRKSKKDIIINWKKENPEGTIAECIAATGAGRRTVYRHWNLTE